MTKTCSNKIIDLMLVERKVTNTSKKSVQISAKDEHMNIL